MLMATTQLYKLEENFYSASPAGSLINTTIQLTPVHSSSSSTGTLRLSGDDRSNTNSMASRILHAHKTVSKSSSIQSLRHKFSTGSLFGRSKGKDQVDGDAFQQLQKLFERPSRGDLREIGKENERDIVRCDCVVPCLCDVLGRELGVSMGNVHVGLDKGREVMGNLGKLRHPEEEEELDEAFLIDLGGGLRFDKTIPVVKEKEQGRPVLHIETGTADITRASAPQVQNPETRRHSTYDSLPMSARALRHKVGSVQPTQVAYPILFCFQSLNLQNSPTLQSISNISATSHFVVPQRPPPHQHSRHSSFIPRYSVDSSATSPISPIYPASGVGHNFLSTVAPSCRPHLHGRTTSSSSLLTTSTLSLSSYLSGTTSTNSSRPGTPRSGSDKDSAFVKEYVSFPPYREGQGNGVSSYASSLEDVRDWVGGVGRRITRRIRRGSMMGQGKNDDCDKESQGLNKRGRGGRTGN